MRVGVITGMHSSTPYEFSVRLDQENKSPGYMLQIDDVVKVSFHYNPYGKITYYGIVTEIEAKWDNGPLSGYEEDVALKGLKPAFKIFTASCMTTRMLIEKDGTLIPDAPEVPPPPGTLVELATRDEVNVALSFDTLLENNLAVPVGVFRNGKPAYVDVRYILGENGAHINISGQSGVAAKTSYATFLMKSLLDTGARLAEKNELMASLARSRFLIFNVKGEGLMFLDKWSREWKSLDGTEKSRQWRDIYSKTHVKAEPFPKVSFCVPRKSPRSSEAWVNKRVGEVSVYGWNTVEIFKLGLFELMFDPNELENNQNLQLATSTIAEHFLQKLEIVHNEALKYCSIHKCKPSTDEPDVILEEAIKNGFDLSLWGIPETLSKLIKELSDEESELRRTLLGQLGKGTISAVVRRLKSVEKIGMNLVWTQPNFLGAELGTSSPGRIPWDNPGQVTVIDISKLRSRVQSFVVGAVLAEVMKSREEKPAHDPVFVFLDELNKYAPRHGGGPLGNIFRDIAERGRSFRVILMGAEQTASEVDYRVITQSSTVVVGRQKGAELERSEYSHLTSEQKQRASLLQQGEVMIDQPFMRSAITVKFPLPAWCTREGDEYEMSREDFEKSLEKFYGD